MPIYTYECEECGVRFDKRQKFSDDPITECPECSGHTHRVPQPVGIVFKGSGWYVKDSKGKNNLAVSGSKKDGGDSESKTETKSDTNSDAKSDAKTSSSSAKSDSSAS